MLENGQYSSEHNPIDALSDIKILDFEIVCLALWS